MSTKEKYNLIVHSIRYLQTQIFRIKLVYYDCLKELFHWLESRLLFVNKGRENCPHHLYFCDIATLLPLPHVLLDYLEVKGNLLHLQIQDCSPPFSLLQLHLNHEVLHKLLHFYHYSKLDIIIVRNNLIF